MKTTPPRLNSSRRPAHSQVAEGRRVSNASSPRTILDAGPRWWTAAVLGRVTLAVMLVAGPFGAVQRLAAQGVVPERFSFQGYMEDGNGPLGATTPVNYPVVFRIYPAATGGTTALWAERQVVTFDKGNYSVILGQGTAVGGELHGDLSAVVTTQTGSELYVQTTVTYNGSDVPILPRLRLLPTPYAFLAKKALTAEIASRAEMATNALTAAFASQAGTAITATTATTATTALTAQTAVTAQTAQSVASVNGSVITANSVPQTALAPAVVTSLTGTVADNRLSANVALRAGGNTLTGNQTINSGNLTVNGDATVTGNLRFGATGQYSPALSVAGVNMQIIAGRLPALFNNTDGGLSASGDGWSAVRVSSDLRFWRVTFNPQFTTPPTIIATWARSGLNPDGSDSAPAIVTYNNGASFIVYGNTFGANGSPVETHFIAIGSR